MYRAAAKQRKLVDRLQVPTYKHQGSVDILTTTVLMSVPVLDRDVWRKLQAYLCGLREGANSMYIQVSNGLQKLLLPMLSYW